ncbi:SWIM zinc finger family protein [Streptomyces sp. NPDC089919]|uniref:SWIM zinc finger family protein n=1 Tax=Streptomyces sp. NPDC089919 TaxID=3155188 RepID=UPI00343CC2E9
MTVQGVRWTSEQVLSLAPDEASRKAGSKLGGAGPWSQTGGSGSGAVWGVCKGSGRTPYRTVVDLTGPAYQCSCPSRKFPCKHALGLLLRWAAEDGAVPEGDGPAPDWAAEWLAARAAREAQRKDTAAGRGPADPEAARRRADRRAGRIGAGVLELEQRLADLLRTGLAGQEQAGYAAWEETAARMVDAQAPGLAARVRELGTIPSSGPGWPVRMLEECALLHLLDRAWLARDGLPAPLAATVRTRVGLPGAPAGEPVRDRWQVLAQYDTVSPDGRLTTRRLWLRGTTTARTALLLDYAPAGRPPQLSLPTGLLLDAEATFHEGSAGLRAELGERFGVTGWPPADDPTLLAGAPAGGRDRSDGGAGADPLAGAAAGGRPRPDGGAGVGGGAVAGTSAGGGGWAGGGAGVPPGVSTGAALAAYGEALRADPWLDSWPVVLAGVVPVPGEPVWQLADADGGAAVPVRGAVPWRLAAVSGGGPLTVFGECGHQGFRPLTAWAPDSPDPVPLP